jgi:hypothetical protein
MIKERMTRRGMIGDRRPDMAVSSMEEIVVKTKSAARAKSSSKKMKREKLDLKEDKAK